ncbi:hypothetical protein [Silvimonas sp.]|uniref:hypothetical protein n=1 Tax=Silvimonas sp. TaxID=2650811 RepID=UPI002848B652|nr:hypothetical protein [Silvimonas sp.]MDR3427963.1 hypothetical protein [Silvimonas sp.]
MRIFRFRPHHCRCRKCQARKKLARHPDNYLRTPACPQCGNREWRVDRWMMRRDTRKQACTCEAYHYWHRIGGGKCLYDKGGALRDFELIAA